MTRKASPSASFWCPSDGVPAPQRKPSIMLGPASSRGPRGRRRELLEHGQELAWPERLQHQLGDAGFPGQDAEVAAAGHHDNRQIDGLAGEDLRDRKTVRL